MDSLAFWIFPYVSLSWSFASFIAWFACAQVVGCMVPLGFPWLIWCLCHGCGLSSCDLWLPLPGLWAGFGLSLF